MSVLYKWVVIGGGIHGCTIASCLIKKGKAASEDLLIVDPFEEPMARWKKNTELIGMEYLRSPSVHHIDTDPFSLQKYACTKGELTGSFFGRYKRPSLDLFNEHSDFIMKETCLKKSWHKGRVISIKKVNGLWELKTEKEEILNALNIVFAISVNDQLNIPEWAEQIKEKSNNSILHIYDEELNDLSSLEPPIAIVGGGISAAHLAIKLSVLFPGEITLIKRHPYRVHDFDSDPGWLGPKKQSPYQKLKNYDMRRNMIRKARHKGSLPGDLFRKLKKLENDGKISVEDGTIESVSLDGRQQLNIIVGNQIINVKHILLATGFQPSRPGGKLIDALVQEQNLLCANCGYPIVNKSLQWCPHLYVSGPLAELEIGPIARNIAGARQAAERIIYGL
ncbi:FAD/NAD(P)-binding protein [Cytobacillus oceanisediminis]|uniref:NADPH-dependent L-lysine 6-monooxygenase-like protein n=1 Tax=Cytobacillus oceanisediminis TaxID=665099 RepID=A0A562JCE2_9BACI|nr:FAD/NAD(P)-binding protein [Cytobacillus oceanisediminis]TWH80849.1 NADPH-dependent L-lysine 6-monooxygenase-like protein [Cytobacillus oceanisediminis]